MAVALQRLGRMDLVEIAGRTRQEAAKWWERVGARTAGPRLRARADGGDHGRALVRQAVESFFAGAAEDRTASLLAHHAAEESRAIVAAADRVLEGRFDLLGYQDLSFGDPIDWHVDPVAGLRSPRVHWSRIDVLDPVSVGDSKVVWELNRHQWLVTLGQAYALTGDERYAEAFAARVSHWLQENPPGIGINWASSLELAIRLIAWCWALVLFRRSPALTAELFGRVSASIDEHATRVERYLSFYSSPNTHLTGEALGLLYAGAVFPDRRAAGRWRRRGAEILMEQSGRQVMADGVYFEQSTCYQRYTVEILLHFMILSARAGAPVPAVLGERVQSMLDFLLAVRRPDGEAPPIGDSDGGWLLPLARREAGDLRGVFGPAAALFGRPDYAWAAGAVTPELLWLLGADGLAAYQSIAPAAPAAVPSQLFDAGGYAVMRDRWDRSAHHLIFDVGPLGCPVTGGHGHADLLSIQCSAFGVPFIVDAGTGSYADETWRRYFRGTAAHNTVTVDGEGQAEPAAPFTWRQRPRARLRRWVTTEGFDLADAEHDAYGRLPEPVRHRRRVLFVKPRYWMLLDEITGTGSHRIELRFQFAPLAAALEGELWARASAAGRGLLVRAFADVPVQARLGSARQRPIEGWVSRDYGRRAPAPVLVYSASAPLPLRVLTLLLPVADAAAPAPVVRPLFREGAGIVGLRFEQTGEEIDLDDIAS
jgi:hypothetical protein